ncbi:hypothetical protein [Urbifossiella limnaea]|uniref:Type II toxin-antitoxin system RelE/ParE family toxin n=1 Tax=Urbifossiella limnaea TaxID=2528023 RepID=A0A517XP47_9BACT|nr:hypothetical protein [Urbifossiella limnaea]QDU19252.1 hypothetical protein ETAA1_11580 [Urbifossiella limnaea]
MFEYEWLEPILDKLTRIYVSLDVPSRDRMAGAVEGFNARLASEPLDVGESRVGGYRVAFVSVLMITFHVNLTTRRVRVTDVIRFGR